jgi:hypothetical protein
MFHQHIFSSLDCIMNHLNSVHIFITNFFNVHEIISIHLLQGFPSVSFFEAFQPNVSYLSYLSRLFNHSHNLYIRHFVISECREVTCSLPALMGVAELPNQPFLVIILSLFYIFFKSCHFTPL